MLGLFTRLTKLRWCKPWWTSCATTVASCLSFKLLVIILSYLHEVGEDVWGLDLCAPHGMCFQAFFGLSLNASLLSIIPPLISHYEHGHFTLALTIESLRIGQQALNSFKWVLNERWSTLSIKLTTIASSSSQLGLNWKGGLRFDNFIPTKNRGTWNLFLLTCNPAQQYVGHRLMELRVMIFPPSAPSSGLHLYNLCDKRSRRTTIMSWWQRRNLPNSRCK